MADTVNAAAKVAAATALAANAFLGADEGIAGTNKPVSPLPAFIPSFLQPMWGFPGFRFIINYIQASYRNDPVRSFLELCLVIFVIWWTSRTKYKQGRNEVVLTEGEVDELVEDWKPEPLVPALSEAKIRALEKIPVIDGPSGVMVRLNGKTPAINFASYNHLGVISTDKARETAISVLRQYGVGSCGPPGFYGTLDVHQDLEKHIAEFTGFPSAILYSQGMSTTLSIIPCFSKRGDTIVADEAVSFAVQQAINLSRSRVYWYKHNDMRDLESVLKKVNSSLAQRKGPLSRRFIVTEGLFQNTSQIAPLPEIIELKEKYKYRLILDESHSFGVLGKRGAGLTDYFNVPTEKIDLMIGSLCNAIGVSGGFCAADKDLISHQRLSGLGYCFSASMPAILSVASSDVIGILSKNPESLLAPLRRNTKLMHEQLSKISGINVEGHQESPIIHVSISPTALTKRKSNGEWTRGDVENALQDLVDEALKNGVLLTRAQYVDDHEHLLPNPSIRICVSAQHSEKDIAKCAKVISNAVQRVTKKK
ncbi:serine palmitoyltransferase component [Mycoemilia scoparia]|uniref:serine C-palmitoyltransferase n=1 Tax=Mycoemilia scoparia TaxID=417184 RepID=A0A9W7ZVN0_9FUNG|nr:serine palmitoyltransferase component [Mycoemilia scoparia]